MQKKKETRTLNRIFKCLVWKNLHSYYALPNSTSSARRDISCFFFLPNITIKPTIPITVIISVVHRYLKNT